MALLRFVCCSSLASQPSLCGYGAGPGCARNSDKFHEKVIAENGVEIVDCMWSMAQLQEFLKHQHGGTDMFAERCKQRMRDIAKHALVCAQGQVEHRKNSWWVNGSWL